MLIYNAINFKTKSYRKLQYNSEKRHLQSES